MAPLDLGRLLQQGHQPYIAVNSLKTCTHPSGEFQFLDEQMVNSRSFQISSPFQLPFVVCDVHFRHSYDFCLNTFKIFTQNKIISYLAQRICVIHFHRSNQVGNAETPRSLIKMKIE